jgi:shikimate kinase/3-dehydroquinate synthase
MTRNLPASPGHPSRSIVLVGLMGAGKTSIGRRLAARLGLAFYDSDAEIERVTGYTVSDLFAQHGEAAFRDGERRVILRLLAGPPIVLATGGGAFMDSRTRAALRDRAISIWLRTDLPTLLRRVSGRSHRPLLAQGDPAEILEALMRVRYPVYAEADLTLECGDDSQEATTDQVLAALATYRPPRRLEVSLADRSYDLVIGPGLLARAGALLFPVLPQPRCVVVTDATVAALHLPTLRAGLTAAGIAIAAEIIVPPGEASKSLDQYGAVADAILASGADRHTTLIAFGGGVIGDLAGFAAATVLRGLPFMQIPTTLLAQVDSSVGGKTGINTARGKNLLGAFHQPLMVLADTEVLATLPPRELRAGYAEIVKAGLIGDAAFYEWCEANGAALIAGDDALQAEAIDRACAFKAAVVGEDERELKPSGGRALLNLGHTFAHALEAEIGYGGILHGEAVGLGLGLAFRLSASLGLCDPALAPRIEAHLDQVGLPPTLDRLNRRLSAARLIARFASDKKMRAGRLSFVLARGIGQAFTTADVPDEAVRQVLQEAGCSA